MVHEEVLTLYNTWPGLPAEALIRADMVYFETRTAAPGLRLDRSRLAAVWRIITMTITFRVS